MPTLARRAVIVLAPLALLAAAHSARTEDSDYESIVRAAFAALDNGFETSWAYTETVTEGERTWVGRHDPGRPAGERWSLVSVDGRAPSAGERETWLAERQERGTDGDSKDGPQDPDIVTPGSIELLDETGDSYLFAFRPRTDGDDADEDAFMAEVDGTLRIRKEGPWLEELRLTNKSPIRPATGVKISKFDTRMQFGPAAPNGPVVPLAIEVHLKGRAYVAIGFEENEQIRYSDYAFVGEQALPEAAD